MHTLFQNRKRLGEKLQRKFVVKTLTSHAFWRVDVTI
jgi:hypothetical protein